VTKIITIADNCFYKPFKKAALFYSNVKYNPIIAICWENLTQVGKISREDQQCVGTLRD
jgi:hypothetical protein